MAKVKAEILGDVDPPAPRLRRVKKSLDEAGRSTQVPEDTWDYQKTAAKEPPYNLEALAYLLEINTFHFRCCKTKAIVTAGHPVASSSGSRVESPPTPGESR